MFSNKMLTLVLSNHRLQFLKQARSIHVVQVLNQQPLLHRYGKNVDRSLFFTNWPKKKREKRPKVKSGKIISGGLIIDCKRKELNHYSGMQYGKLDVVPLASKGWHHRKSKGDYFTILPSALHPAFITKENLVDTFEGNGISEKLVRQLEAIGVTHPTVIQAKTITTLLRGENALITSECGSGKTLGYIIATIENVLRLKEILRSTGYTAVKYNSPLAIIVLPTKELALQIGEQTSTLCSELDVNCQTLVGGETKSLLKNPEMKNVDILVCTPLVLEKHLYAKLYSTKLCRHVVFDEADTLTEEGFLNQIKTFIKLSKLKLTGYYDPDVVENCCQVCFFSATVPDTLESRLQELIQTTKLTTVSTPHLHKNISHIPQKFMRVGKSQRAETLLQIVKSVTKQRIPTMIFCNNKRTSNWVSHFLDENGVPCPRINQSHMSETRLSNFRKFKEGIVYCVSCTDLASRGLHFDNVRRVINFEFPNYMADYIHRCGRTGRIGHGNDCLIMNFISSAHEIRLLNKIEKAVRTNTRLPSVRSDRHRKVGSTI